uniref:Laminin EGF-like domain-containing protein n=1 Tax=Callorhinchus milii TaxID=7868 RepID=A0A4W3HJW9_CALMI
SYLRAVIPYYLFHIIFPAAEPTTTTTTAAATTATTAATATTATARTTSTTISTAATARCNCSVVGSADPASCDVTSGQCDCLAGYTGLVCDQCVAGYHPNITNGECVLCGCNATGAANFHCDSTGRCRCKVGVSGLKCDQCRLGHHGFSEAGCQHCQCSNHSTTCDYHTGKHWRSAGRPCTAIVHHEGGAHTRAHISIHTRTHKHTHLGLSRPPGIFSEEYNDQLECERNLDTSQCKACDTAVYNKVISTGLT